jgi:hypothetical protein
MITAIMITMAAISAGVRLEALDIFADLLELEVTQLSLRARGLNPLFRHKIGANSVSPRNKKRSRMIAGFALAAYRVVRKGSQVLKIPFMTRC